MHVHNYCCHHRDEETHIVTSLHRRYSNLIDCAIYFTHTYTERGSNRPATTLLLDKSVVRRPDKEKENPQLAMAISEAQLNGIPIDTVVGFYTSWQQSQSTRGTPGGRR